MTETRRPKSPPRKVALTDRSMKALKPNGARQTVWDSLMPGMAVRVSALGQRSFYAIKTAQGAATATWHLLGIYPVMTLAEAREAAREAIKAISAGEHPKALAAAKREVAAADAREAETHRFGKVADRWLRFTEGRDDAPRASSMRMYRSYLDRWLRPALDEKPVPAITRRDVIGVVEAVRDGSGNASARGAMALLGSILNWALDQGIPGYVASPAAGLRAKNLIGGTAPRERTLKDTEIAAVWRATEAVGAPFATIYRLLLLLGLRRAEIAEARWDELGLEAGTLEIPGTRTKNGEALLVPLPPEALRLFAAVPRFAGPFVFSTSAGRKPVAFFSAAKDRLDRALADQGADLAEFNIHDFRRVVRSGLSRLGIANVVAEAVLGHKRKGIEGTYDKWAYETEKRAALEKWQAHLLAIVTPPPGNNVVPLRERATA